MNNKEYQYHEIANIFPMMTKEEQSELINDIKTNGLKTPIILYQDKILDGRNRYEACVSGSVEPKFTTYTGNEPVSYVMSLNLQRRHLTAGQRACVSVEVEEPLAKEAKQRQIESGKYDRKQVKEIFPQPVLEKTKTSKNKQSRDIAAEMFDVNPRYIQDAKKLKNQNVELHTQVKEGKKTITQAMRELNRENNSKVKPIEPTDKYRVIYADPPWSYNDTRDGLEEATGASTHYPTMTLKDICNLPVKEWTEDNAVLFLWATSPLLFQSADVISSWGFKYKTSFVWDKVKHNMGHYNSVRHEFLLIATKGSCLPDINKLIDSVQSIERTEHSVKPKEFRTIIDTLYTHGKKLEIFSRTKLAGWDVYGNDSKL